LRRAVAEKDGKVQYSLRRWRYDIHNNIVAEKTWLTMQSATSASGLARTIWREYDAQNRCLRVTDSLGAEVRYTYNSIGKRTSETRKISGEETQYIKYAYDAAGRLLERAEKSTIRNATASGGRRPATPTMPIAVRKTTLMTSLATLPKPWMTTVISESMPMMTTTS